MRIEHCLAPLPTIRGGRVDIQVPEETDSQWLTGMSDVMVAIASLAEGIPLGSVPRSRIGPTPTH